MKAAGRGRAVPWAAPTWTGTAPSRSHALHLNQLGDDFVQLATTLQLAAERANREPPLLLEDFSGTLQQGDEAH